MDVAALGGATLQDALDRARRAAAAGALELVVDGAIVARAGVPPPSAPEDDDLCDGVSVRRWGGTPLNARDVIDLLGFALVAAARERVVADDARASAAVFLGATTHEVKTPLTVVLGTLRLLQQHGSAVDDDQRRMLLSMASRRTRDVARLVDGVLHTARSQLSPEVTRRCLIADVVADAVSGVEFGATVDVEGLPEAWIEMDPASGRAIVGSLLDDAITRGGAVRVRAEQQGHVLVVRVSNTDRTLESLQADGRYEPAAPEADAPAATSGLHLAAMLAEATGGSLRGGVAGDAALFHLRLPSADPRS